MKDEPIDLPNKVPASNGANNDIVKESGVEFVVPVKNHHISSEDEVDIQVRTHEFSGVNIISISCMEQSLLMA